MKCEKYDTISKIIIKKRINSYNSSPMKHKLKRINNRIETDLYFILRSLPDDISFHESHGLIHPAEMYELLMVRVTDAFRRVLRDIYSQNDYSDQMTRLSSLLQQTKAGLSRKLSPDESVSLNNNIVEYENRLKQIFELEDHENKKVLDSQEELLGSLLGFAEDSFHILQCFYPADTVAKNVESVQEWLEYADKHLYREYVEKIDSYLGNLAPIVHAIRDNNAPLKQARLRSEHGYIDGYYLEGVDNKGIMGPDRKIHKLFRNTDTAFSYNRELKYHLVNLIFITHHIKTAIGKILHKKHIEITNNEDGAGESEKLFHIAEQIEKLPYLFYPDEVYKQIPEVKVTDDAVTFILPSNDAKPLIYIRSEIRSGIGEDRQIRLPYTQSKSATLAKRPILR